MEEAKIQSFIKSEIHVSMDEKETEKLGQNTSIFDEVNASRVQTDEIVDTKAEESKIDEAMEDEPEEEIINEFKEEELEEA